MTRLISTACSVVAAFTWCVAAYAVDYPKKVFDATYEVVNPASKAVMRMASDGKGHMRTETNSAASKVVTISDYPNAASLTLMEAQKMAIKGKLNADSYQGAEPADMKKKNARDLGSKVVAGHPCHGWEYTTTSGKTVFVTQIWTGDDTGWLVQSTSKLPTGDTVQTLKSWSAAPPSPTLFSMNVPDGYKVMGL
jgi:hypothetical protein